MLFILGKFDPAARLAAACALSAALSFAAPAAAASLSGDPYIKAPPFSPPPLAGQAPQTPLGGRPPAHSAQSRAPYSPPLTHYRPRPAARPGKAARRAFWCAQNHPSYRPADNTYRPFDRSGTMPPQARVPCAAPEESK